MLFIDIITFKRRMLDIYTYDFILVFKISPNGISLANAT